MVDSTDEEVYDTVGVLGLRTLRRGLRRAGAAVGDLKAFPRMGDSEDGCVCVCVCVCV